jgi:hypothetical protein
LSRREHAHLVRYEDLARNPEETLESLLAYLELDASPEVISGLLGNASEQRAAPRGHMTSESPEASIGRWKQERDEAFRRVCDESFADALNTFGYE